MESSDYNRLIDQIVSLYEDVSEVDRQKLKNSICSMAESVFSHINTFHGNSLFSQSIINFNNANAPKIQIYYTSLYMSSNGNGKSVGTKQSYQVTKATYKVIPGRISANAGALTRLEKKQLMIG